jgi:DeoR/GlpR family transcriptional regulator of sugar metabolism
LPAGDVQAMCEPFLVSGLRDRKRPVVPAERRRLIVELLREQGSVSVRAVEELFGVSPMTARRDLALLAESGYARRTHGGAMLPELAGHEDSFQSRVQQDVEVKTRLAKVVMATIKPSETVFVDSSSSACYIVREILESGMPVTLLTNSLPVMSVVGSSDAPQVELIGIGGNFRQLTRSFVGAGTLRMIERFFVDRVVFSVKGIEPGGFLTDPDPLEADVKRAMIDRARTVVLVAHAQKFDERGLNVIVPADAVDLACLADPPAAGVEALEVAGVEVHRI